MSNRFMVLLIPLISALLGSYAQGNVRALPRKIADYQLLNESLSLHDSVWVEGARLAYANYPALLRDFPALKKYSQAQIDELLLLNFSYISKAQLQLQGLRNTDIPANPIRSKKSYRPSGYGRADVMEFLDFDGSLIGVLDRKGTGVSSAKANLDLAENLGNEKIQTFDHTDGLMSLGEVLAETTRESARRRLYQIENTKAETVESYFALALPFSIKKGGSEVIPAGIYGRQAHFGRIGAGFQTPLPKSEVLAIQCDYFNAGVDQGMVRITDPRLASTFGRFGPEVRDSQRTADWAFAHDTARAFVASGNRQVVENHLREMLQPLDSYGPSSTPDSRSSLEAEILTFFKTHPLTSDHKRRNQLAIVIGHLTDPSIVQKAKLESTINALLSDGHYFIRLLTVPVIRLLPRASQLHWHEILKDDPSDRVRLRLPKLSAESPQAGAPRCRQALLNGVL